MADIAAFRAYRYDLGRAGALSDLVAPPYDVINDELQARLYDRSPHNIVRVEWNRPQADDNDSHNRYTRAAGFLRDWVAGHLIAQDSARSLYVLHQEYEIEGRKHIRRGFFARVRLEPFGQGRIYPHEETMSGPKQDRLLLMQATGMNLSPVFGLYPDPDAHIQTLLDQAVARRPPIEAVDHLGVVSRLWPITDEHAVSSVVGLMGPKPIFIADGHHRYETGLRYLEEKRQAGEVINADAPANFIMMALVGMSDPGLLILPTHRLVSGLPAVSTQQLRDALQGHFDIVADCGTNARAAWDSIEADGAQSIFGFGTVADGAWFVARLRDGAVMDSLAADHSPAWRGLGVSILHRLVLDRLLPERFGGKPACRFVHLVSEVTDAVAAKSCQIAVMVPPATMGHVEQIAGTLEKMPPKSTYFYPKLLTGLVLHSLKGN
jgi:uncharacterized protein (DUF1015 family)